MTNWKLESDVNYWVLKSLESLGLRKGIDFNDESAMSDYMKDALQWWAKTQNKTNFGKPDFHVEKYKIPVIIEDKLSYKKLLAWSVSSPKNDDASIRNFSVNGALHYARTMISSGKYKEVIAIGVAGDNEENVEIQVYYVYGYGLETVKYMPHFKNFSFLQNQEAFDKFYEESQLTEWEKHKILVSSKISLWAYAKKLNKMLHQHDISVAERVLYVSWMLLSMQNVFDGEGNIKIKGLTDNDLNGYLSDGERDGQIVLRKINSFLKERNIPDEKTKIMLNSFSTIASNPQRDLPVKLDPEVSKLIQKESSVKKQIFVFIYENIYKRLDEFKGHLDVMGELYSSFLKYALGDGKDLGIVLTPPYVTKMMCEMIDINQHSRVLDLTTGSAGFLISAMEHMIDDVGKSYTKGSTLFDDRVKTIKSKQLFWIEKNGNMYTLAATNMILRGDGASNIVMDDALTFDLDKLQKFNADKFLLNPPYSKDENGIQFFSRGLGVMEKWGFAAVIIQDSAWSGKADKTNKHILKHHTLLASIKMPTDLFQPMAWVQTSIYIFEARKPHDFGKPVKFIDFRNDGYKRTSRSLQEVDSPVERYEDVIKILKAGKSVNNLKASWDLNAVYVEDFIDDSGKDWNFDQHQKIDITPTLSDFKKTVSDYLAWEVSQILQKNNENSELGTQISPRLRELEEDFKHNGGKFEKKKLEELFEVKGNPQLNKDSFEFDENWEYPYFTRTVLNNGIAWYVKYLDEEHKIKWNSIAVWMLWMQFFYMEKDFYAGQFTKTIFPRFERFNSLLAQYFIALMNKNQKIFQGSLVRDFEKLFYATEVALPLDKNGEISFDFMEKYIKALEAERLEELEAYLLATGLKDYHLTEKE